MIKPKTFSKIFLQFVFAVRNREALLNPAWDGDLYKYIGGIIRNKEQIPLAINGHREHIHIFASTKPSCVISDLVREIKKASTEYVNSRRLVRRKFAWQDGYGAFSYARWDVDKMIAYVDNQKEHHRRITFRDEYIALLKEFEIEPDGFMFDWQEEKTPNLTIIS